jgi:hypothetical protein
MRLRFVMIAAVLAAATTQAANVFTVTGSNGFGFAGSVIVEGWSQTVGYTGVTITAPLEDFTPGGPIGTVEGVVYLVNQIGAGTTSANNVAAPISVSGLTGAFVTTTLWTGLTLPPGNYWVVWVPTNLNSGSPSMTPEGASTPNFTDTPGVGAAAIGSGQTAGSAAAFPPATVVSTSTPDNMFITVTGTQSVSTTPAPSALLLMLTAIAGLGIFFLVRARRGNAVL